MGVDGSERADSNLDKVDHVVVMMLENRSFDHMLGYLSLRGRRPDIDGLRPAFANEYQGCSYPIHHLETTALDMDPDHSSSAIDQQIAGGSMGGFVASAAATLAERGADGDPACVMGYYDAADVPVYDHLTEEFAVCDRWFSSVPGATLPNRLYGLCGVAAGSRDDRPVHVPPLYHQPSFVRHLDAAHVPWRWYSFDPGTLRLASGARRRARGGASPAPRHSPSSRTGELGAMLEGGAALPTQPDAIDAMVVVAAALHAPAQVLTSDPGDITAYAATLDRADITVERI